MAVISGQLENDMKSLAELAKNVGVGYVQLWLHVGTEEGYTDWTIFARDSFDSEESEMLGGKTFEEAMNKLQKFIISRDEGFKGNIEKALDMRADRPSVMRFIDAPMGCRFRYKSECDNPGKTWIKISVDGTGLIAEYDDRRMKTPGGNGQMICSFADTEEQMRTLEIEVIG